MIEENVLKIVRANMRFLKSPSHHEKVYKEECMFTFDTPETPDGIFVNLRTFQGFGAEYVGLDHERTGNALYLNEKWHRIPLPVEEQQDDMPNKLAIGGEGGFQVDKEKYKIEKEHALVLMPEKIVIPLPCPDLPEIVLQSIKGVMDHESASLQETVATWEEERRVSKYAADLPLLDTGRKISPDPKEWKCDETGVTENLWLNLSTGFVGSGRQNWDGTGGNGAALRHFEATGSKYPLVVKLGTITPQGADVYSYAPDESDMVEDPLLDKHLAHWGINMAAMRRTEKTMAELQIELNMSYEFDRITESGAALKPLRGPGFVGLVNLGNSCYMNSVLQVLWTVPQLQERYVAAANRIFRSSPEDPSGDLPSQMAKVGVALIQGRTGKPAPSEAADKADTDTVRPLAFKSLVGRGHAEFASARQQDAAEYFQHLLELLSRTEHANSERLGLAEQAPTTTAFTFQLEDRVQCMQSGYVSYRQSTTNMLPLGIPLEHATNKAEVQDYQEREAKRQKLKEVQADAYIMGSEEGGATGGEVLQRDSREEPVIPRVPFQACLEQWAGAEMMEDYFSAVLAGKSTATKRARIASFPPYLMVQMKRYYVASDWTPKKLEVLVDVPDHLSLEHLRATGPQPGESLQPEDDAAPSGGAAAAGPAASAAVEPSPELVAALVEMGFSENGSKRAAVATQNAGTEAAMEWVLGHMEDPDFNDPLPAPAASSGATSGPAADPAHIASLADMGFTPTQAEAALKACSNSIERAADWLFSHMDDLDSAVAAVMAPAAQPGAGGSGSAAPAPAARVLDGKGEYSLVAFVSHMGSNTACGHYVCHIKKGGRWAIFNDEKVAESEHPPRDLGYLYLFKRNDA